jgi:tetratricopeptide (TPR) repeat protein
MPLSGLRIGAVADHVVVREGGARWQAESGQYLLAFEGDPDDGSLCVISRTPAAEPAGDPEEWFARGLALEAQDADAAIAAYERAIDADKSCLDAYVNLGRLLHDGKRLAKAETVYREALRQCGTDAVLLYNLGVLLDDMGRTPDAMTTYQAALRADPDFADCHYNLALLCERLAKPKEAIRHMARYRLLAGRRPK